MKNKIALITKSYDQNGRCIIDCQKWYFGPTEVDTSLGNASKAEKKLN